VTQILPRLDCGLGPPEYRLEDEPDGKATRSGGRLRLGARLVLARRRLDGERRLRAQEPGARGLDALGVALALAGSAPLLLRRRAVVPAFFVVFAAYVAIAALRYPIDVMLGPLIALYTLAGASGRTVRRPLAIGLAALSYLSVGVGIALGYDLARVADAEAVLFACVWIAIWVAGDRSQLRRDRVVWLEERAARAEDEARRERMLAAAEERTQIARDLHDSAGHAINVILMQAGAARLLRERDPERSEQAIRTIEEVAREQIGEIDRLVHALREQDSGPEAGECRLPGDVPSGPEAGRALLERMQASGLALEVEQRGEPRRLGPTVGRTTYRILQEALTNAARHGTGSASVTMDFGEEAVELTIENPVERQPSIYSIYSVAFNGNGVLEGHGLVGMRERVGLLGGRFDAGFRRGSFRVRATLPYDPSFERLLASKGGERG
jgi:signal transduction histidine kinase